MSETTMQGKTVMVTGASTGIGKATAVGIARLGASLVLVCRSEEKARAAVEEIKAKSGNPDVSVLLADLSSQQSIRALAEEYRTSGRPLHVLVNNAGAIVMERRVTVDGIESTFAVNHLGYFLLTQLLLDVLKKSAPARIVNVASEAHRSGRFDWDDLQHERGYRGFRAYGDSKLANICFTYELSRRLASSGVTVNCLHPGVVASNFGQGDGTRWMKWAVKIVKPFFISTEQGAATSIWLATSPEVEGVTGKYFSKCREKRSSGRSYDEAAQTRLWNVSEKLTGLAT